MNQFSVIRLESKILNSDFVLQNSKFNLEPINLNQTSWRIQPKGIFDE